MARNVVERVFGVIKRRFPILTSSPEFDIKTQAKIVCAFCALHNFIRTYDPSDIDSELASYRMNNTEDSNLSSAQVHSNSNGEEGAANRRNRLATEMWNDYQQYTRDEQEEEFQGL